VVSLLQIGAAAACFLVEKSEIMISFVFTMRGFFVRIILLAAFACLVASCASPDSETTTEAPAKMVPGESTGEGTVTPGTSMTGPSASIGW
jgi:hypothetical protein